MRIRRQAPAARVRHKGAKYQVITQGTHRQCGDDAEQPIRFALLDKVAGHAEKAEARTLQQQAEQRPAEQGQAQRLAVTVRAAQLPGSKHQA